MTDLYAAVARLLDYPGPEVMEDGRCLALSSGEAHRLLQAFRTAAQDLGIARLQETYIETFDFHAETSPYIGHHLFGEEIRRSLFMAELRGRYRECGVVENSELPDHLASILRFLGAMPAGEERVELIHACLIPALRHMLAALKPDNPYSPLLQAIVLISQQEATAVTPDGEIAWISFCSWSFPTSR
ncbi:MAG TPA: molecular chaperone TorD family protein [Terriglobales bacterium]|nr:molecular chaperone TorD family protein [Terriglobales bacterium]